MSFKDVWITVGELDFQARLHPNLQYMSYLVADEAAVSKLGVDCQP